jgi:hypothetical protein
MSFLWTEGFSCSLDVLYGGLGISKLQFLMKKERKKIFSCIFFFILVIETLDPYLDPNSLEMLDPDPYPDSIHNTANKCNNESREPAVWYRSVAPVLLQAGCNIL